MGTMIEVTEIKTRTVEVPDYSEVVANAIEYAEDCKEIKAKNKEVCLDMKESILSQIAVYISEMITPVIPLLKERKNHGQLIDGAYDCVLYGTTPKRKTNVLVSIYYSDYGYERLCVFEDGSYEWVNYNEYFYDDDTIARICNRWDTIKSEIKNALDNYIDAYNSNNKRSADSQASCADAMRNFKL